LTETWLLVAVILMALVVGALLPVLYQLYQILKRTRDLLDSTRPRLERALDEIGDAVARLDRVGATLESQASTLARILGIASGVVLVVQRAQNWLRTATSLGPALATGALALFSRHRFAKGRRTGIPLIRRFSRTPQ